MGNFFTQYQTVLILTFAALLSAVVLRVRFRSRGGKTVDKKNVTATLPPPAADSSETSPAPEKTVKRNRFNTTEIKNSLGRVVKKLVLAALTVFLLWMFWDTIFEWMLRNIPSSTQAQVREVFDTNTENFWKFLVFGTALFLITVIPRVKVGRHSYGSVPLLVQNIALVTIVFGIAFGHSHITSMILETDAKFFNLYKIMENNYPGTGWILPWAVILLGLSALSINRFLGFDLVRVVAYTALLMLALHLLSWWNKPSVRSTNNTRPAITQPQTTTPPSNRVSTIPQQVLPENHLIGAIMPRRLEYGQSVVYSFPAQRKTCFDWMVVQINGEHIQPGHEIPIQSLVNGVWVDGFKEGFLKVKFTNTNNYPVVINGTRRYC